MPTNSASKDFKVNQLIKQFAIQQLPTIEKEINAVIARKETNLRIIESLLELSSMLTEAGVGKEAYLQLCQYYVTVKQDNKDSR